MLAQDLFRGKMTVVFELKETEYRFAYSIFDEKYDTEKQQFKVDISGTDFIFILDE